MCHLCDMAHYANSFFVGNWVVWPMINALCDVLIVCKAALGAKLINNLFLLIKAIV